LKTTIYQTKGVCSTEIEIVVDEEIVRAVHFMNGCDGNLQGISRLVIGMPVKEVIKRLKGIECDGKPTSCPDQLAMALERILE
jgi:uncharacterized protein (TIGR03905 family)